MVVPYRFDVVALDEVERLGHRWHGRQRSLGVQELLLDIHVLEDLV